MITLIFDFLCDFLEYWLQNTMNCSIILKVYFAEIYRNKIFFSRQHMKTEVSIILCAESLALQTL